MNTLQRSLTPTLAHRSTSFIVGPRSTGTSVRFASKKAAGSTKNNRDSESKRLGVKKFDGEKISAGNIIVRQRGRKFHEGENVGVGKDHTLFAKAHGILRFETKMITCKNKNKTKPRTYVSVDTRPLPRKIPQKVVFWKNGTTQTGNKKRYMVKYTWEEYYAQTLARLGVAQPTTSAEVEQVLQKFKDMKRTNSFN